MSASSDVLDWVQQRNAPDTQTKTNQDTILSRSAKKKQKYRQKQLLKAAGAILVPQETPQNAESRAAKNFRKHQKEKTRRQKLREAAMKEKEGIQEKFKDIQAKFRTERMARQPIKKLQPSSSITSFLQSMDQRPEAKASLEFYKQSKAGDMSVDEIEKRTRHALEQMQLNT
jgi:hypothetical protein